MKRSVGKRSRRSLGGRAARAGAFAGVAGTGLFAAGPAAAAIDRLMLTLGIRRVAEREAAELDPELRRRLQRFCDGVNAPAEAAPAPPFEMRLLRLRFEPWEPIDILSLGKVLAFGL